MDDSSAGVGDIRKFLFGLFSYNTRIGLLHFLRSAAACIGNFKLEMMRDRARCVSGHLSPIGEPYVSSADVVAQGKEIAKHGLPKQSVPPCSHG